MFIHRPLKRVLAQDILNPLSRLVLEGSVVGGDVVQVITLGEAEKNKNKLSWVSSDETSSIKDSVVILRNHEVMITNEKSDVWEDDEFLMEDGVHEHR